MVRGDNKTTTGEESKKQINCETHQIGQTSRNKKKRKRRRRETVI